MYTYIFYILCIYFIFYIYCINTYFVYKHCKWLYILNSFIKRLVLHLHNVTNICSHINIKKNHTHDQSFAVTTAQTSAQDGTHI